MSIAKDFLNLKNEKTALQIAIDNCKPENFDELSKEFGTRFNESLQRIRSITEKDLKKADPELKDEDLLRKIDIMRINQLADLDVQQTWKQYKEFVDAQNSINDERSKLLTENSSIQLTSIIHESDLPENVDFEQVAVLAYFFEETKE